MQDTALLDGTALIVGGGQAGGEVATQLRHNGFRGRIVLIGAEAHLPYARPPLSKGFLSGEIDQSGLQAKNAAAYEKAGIELRLGTHVGGIDRHGRTVSLGEGETLAYDVLVLATGGRPRPLKVPGAGLGNIFTLRNIDDVDAMRPLFRPGSRLVIVGGGYVGLEVAAVATKLGLSVTVLEGAPRVLARVTAPEMSAFYERVHGERGVRIKTGVAVSGFTAAETDPTVVGGVVCGEDDPIPADFVIVGIGLLANMSLAEESGLVVDGGVLVDAHCQTADPRIFAIGDCATHARHGFLDRKFRLESVPNALEQARTCAATICDKPTAEASAPWFWSDQYDLKLQMVGISEGYDRTVMRGNTDGASFVTFYLADGLVIAADAVNRPADFMAARRMVAERRHLAPELLADETIPLKTILAAT